LLISVKDKKFVRKITKKNNRWRKLSKKNDAIREKYNKMGRKNAKKHVRAAN
jgi:hypothetical protein